MFVLIISYFLFDVESIMSSNGDGPSEEFIQSLSVAGSSKGKRPLKPPSGLSTANSEESDLKKGKTLTSDVWKCFTRVVVDGERKAQCHGCRRYLSCKGKNGTSHLIRHRDKCTSLPKCEDIGVMLMDKEGKLRSRKIDPKRIRELMTMAVIEHDLPYSFVEYRWVRELWVTLNPDVRLMTRKTMVADVMRFYQKTEAKFEATNEKKHK